MTGRMEPCTQKPIMNQKCFTTITSTWEAVNVKYAGVSSSSHIKANLTAVEMSIKPSLSIGPNLSTKQNLSTELILSIKPNLCIKPNLN